MQRLITRSALLVVLAVVGLGLFATSASAQRILRAPIYPRRVPMPFYGTPTTGSYGGSYYNRFSAAQDFNPSFVPTQLQANAFRQWAFNTAVVGQVYSQNYAPYLYGYNPYPQVANYGPVYSYPSYPMAGYTPYGNPYLSGYVNPYNPYSSPYSAVTNPYAGGYTSPYSY